MILLSCYSDQAYTDGDDRLRTVHPSIRPRGQRTKIWAQTVHLKDEFGRRTIKNLKIWREVDRWTKVRPWRPDLYHS